MIPNQTNHEPIDEYGDIIRKSLYILKFSFRMFTNSYFDSGRYTTINILFRTVGPKEENRMSCDAMRACRRAYGRAGGLWVGSWWMDGRARGWYAGGGVRGRAVRMPNQVARLIWEYHTRTRKVTCKAADRIIRELTSINFLVTSGTVWFAADTNFTNFFSLTEIISQH